MCKRHLKSKKLIEGRKPNFYIGLKLAQNTGKKAEYTKNKGFDKQYYLDLITEAIKQHAEMRRKEIDELLWNKLPDWMTEKQKKTKVNHLLSELRKTHRIKNTGSMKNSLWILC